MPIVNYKCGSCGKEFAKLYFDEEKAPRSCPVCKSTDLEALGGAFPEDPGIARRFLRASCEECGDDCGGGPVSG
jgi:putative FmdB family regulatory protein